MAKVQWAKSVLATLGLLVLPALLLAQVEVGPESVIAGGGDCPGVAALGNTNVLVWQAGTVRGRLFRPNATVDFAVGGASARLPQVAMDSDGDLVVAWQGDDGAGSGIFARRLRANGAFQGAGQRVNTPVTGNQTTPRLGVAPDGSFVIGWEDTVAGADAIRVARFSADGRRFGRPMAMNAGGGDIRLIGGVGVSDFGFAVGWTEVEECAGGALDLTSAVGRFDASGRALGSVARFNDAAQCAGGPAVAGVLSSYFGPLGVFAGDTVSIQRFSPISGERVAERTVVADLASCTADFCERVATVAGDLRGRVVVVWETKTLDATAARYHYDLVAQLYGREGRARSPRFRINGASSSGEQHPAAALTCEGGFYVAWRRSEDAGSPALANSPGLVYRSFVLSGEPFGG